jgi:phage baseplate assembly protein W
MTSDVKKATDLRTRSFAQHDPATAMASLFRPVARGRRPTGLEVRTTWGTVELEFAIHTAVDTRDQTVLLSILALAAGKPSINSTSTGPTGQQLWLALNEPGVVQFNGVSTVLETTVYALHKESGLQVGGSGYDTIRQSLKRLSRISLTVRDGEVGHRREFSQRFISYRIDEASGLITIAINSRLAEALTGHHVRVNLDERAQLASEPAQIAHAWLSAWLRPGKAGRIGLDKLIERVWGGGDVKADTFRKRRSRLRAAIVEIAALKGWKLVEDDQAMLTITRPALIARSGEDVA